MINLVVWIWQYQESDAFERSIMQVFRPRGQIIYIIVHKTSNHEGDNSLKIQQINV